MRQPLHHFQRVRSALFLCIVPYQVPDSADACRHISLTFPYTIGTCKVVNIADLTKEEQSKITRIERNGKIVRTVKLDRDIPTCACQIILSEDWQLITMYPGVDAPPLPDNPDIHNEFWDYHLFIPNSVVKWSVYLEVLRKKYFYNAENGIFNRCFSQE